MNDVSIILTAALGLLFTAGAIVRDTRYRIAMAEHISIPIPTGVEVAP